MRTRWIETAITTGAAIERHGYTVTPEAWSLTVAWLNGGWVWNRPAAIHVARDGVEQRIPIIDVTLIARVALIVLAAATVLMFATVQSSPKESTQYE